MDKHSPWRLIFDIAGVNAQTYLLRYNVSSTEEYFNQLVDYYKEALTNSMVNEGSRGQAREGRLLASLSKPSKSPNPKRHSVAARFSAHSDVRAIRILGRKFSPKSKDLATKEMAGTGALGTIVRDAASNVALRRKVAAMKEKGIPHTPDAGQKAYKKWFANLDAERRSENQP